MGELVKAGLESFYLRIMKIFLPSLLTSRVPLEKSNVVLISNSLDKHDRYIYFQNSNWANSRLVDIQL